MKYDNLYQVFKDYLLKSLSYYLDYPLVKPERVNIATTYSCPLSCEMCAIKDIDEDEKEEISSKSWKEIIKQIDDWGIGHVSFSGGETLVEKEKTLDLIRFAENRGLEVDLITNGFYLDEDTTKRLLDTGLDRVTLSVDGSNKKYMIL